MKKLLTSMSMLVAVSGCATVIRGTSEKFAIQTEPPGASAVLSTGMTCTTPCALKLKRKDVFNVTFDKSGYQTAHADVKNVQRSGAAFGNILAGGVIGVVVDSGNGSLKSLKPNPLKVTMVPVVEDATAAVPASAPNAPGSTTAPAIATPAVTTTLTSIIAPKTPDGPTQVPGASTPR